MASVLVPKVRLVRCPKCYTLLEEPKGVPVYKCASCETLLQAKNTKSDDNGELMPQKTDPVKSNESRPSSEYHKGSSSSSSEKLLFSSGDCSLDPEKGKNPIDEISDQLVAANKSSREQNNDNQGYRSSLSTTGESGVSSSADSSPELLKNVNYGVPAEETEAKSEGSKPDVAGEHGSGFKPMEARQSFSSITNHKKKAKTFSSHPSLGEHYGKRYNKWNWSEMGFYARGPSFSSGYEIGSSSDQTYHEFRNHSRFVSREMPDAVRSKQKLIPAYSNFELPNQVCHDMGNDRYDKDIGKLGWESRWRMMRERNQTSHSCLCSDQYPPPVSWQYHPSHDHRNSRSSFLGSPRRLLKFEDYPRWSCEIASDIKDHRHSGYEVNKFPRRKYVSKRHVRPTAGAAPFVTCHHCSAVLHLPVDFLIFKRKHHFLKCGVCSKVLKFSLQDSTRLVPAVLDPVPILDTETNGNGEPASCSDDYAEDSNESEMNRLFSKVSISEKTTESETMQPLQTRGSPLHRLMGYSSVSQVFRESGRPPSRTSTEEMPASRLSTTWIKTGSK